jgi:uncharacterized protein DUF5916
MELAPPLAPEVMTRGADGQAIIRAIKLTTPLRMDGVLDEEVYAREKSFGGFLQVVPKYGAEQSERTEVWVMYDTNNMYVACRCWDSAPPDRWVANELRRDTNQLRQNDQIGVMFDTFHDKRSGFLFYTNPLGARADYSVVDEGGSNTDWNPVWASKTGRFEGGWTVEMAIPFKSLRYRSGPNQTWGIQLRRAVRRKNEWAYLTPVPQILAGPQAFNRISAGGTLVGLDLPPAGKNIELKPYATSRVTTDKIRNPPIINDPTGDVGGDAKYGVTANLTADFTANTDFAQVEIDEQQVNLTRFSLFFPEKRDFFLEGRGIFDFARGGAGAQTQGGATTSDLPYLFYSRRIGLNKGREIPIDIGERLTGKAGKYAIGAMNIQTGEEDVSRTEPTNFTVLRLKRDVLRRSAIGAMFTNRSLVSVGSGQNQGYGLDGAFSFFQNISTGVYWAQTKTEGRSGDDQSYQGRFDYSADRYGARAEFLNVGRNFFPDVGYTRRIDINRSFGQLRFSPRPKNVKSVRKFTGDGSLEYVENATSGSLESRVLNGHFATEFESSDMVSFEVNNDYELLVLPFTVPGSSVTIPRGSHTFTDTTTSYTFGAQRRVSGTASVQLGQYYDGTITAVTFGSGRVSVLKQFSVEPTVSVNHIDVSSGDFTSTLLRARADYGFSPLMFTSALLQYSSADKTFSSNLRFRWEYRPGSELFLVYTDERDTTDPNGLPVPRATGLRNRAFVVKINRLFRF